LIVPIIIMKIKTLLSGAMNQPDSPTQKESSLMITSDLSKNVSMINEVLGENNDIITREFFINHSRATIIFTRGLVDTAIINNNILNPLMYNAVDDERVPYSLKEMLPVSECHEESDISIITSYILRGETALLHEKSNTAIILKTSESKDRSIEEPVTEQVVRGPRCGFNENINENQALLRKAGVNKDLRFISFQVGERFKKELVIVYIDGIANEALIQNVKEKIESIHMDNVPESGYIEELIEENSFSLFPQIQSTERPDRVVAALAEGRVGILLDGTPFVLIAPVTINMYLQSPEDYYDRWIPGSLIRLLRYTAAFIAVYTPALYISFVSFHQGLIPTKLAISIIGSREGVPFPVLIEALLMEVSIEILREAGLRLPKPIGQTIGIVGGLVIGEAAVQAGIVSPVTVIVVAITAISSFSLPQYNLSIALRIIRFVAMLLAATLGLYGVIVFFLFFCIHLVRLKSFGTPYLGPAAPYVINDWKDFLIRLPIRLMKKRPGILKPGDKMRKG
jgi:spore germination protein